MKTPASPKPVPELHPMELPKFQTLQVLHEEPGITIPHERNVVILVEPDIIQKILE